MGGDKEDVPEVNDYSKFDPKFTNQVEKIAAEWGELHEKRAEFIAQNRGSYIPQPVVPLNIVGLTPRTGRLPSTRNWYRKTISYERNGFMNIHTPVLNTKFIPWTFSILLLWGWVSFQVQGWNSEYYKDHDERRNSLYYKLQPIELPSVRLWNRPG